MLGKTMTTVVLATAVALGGTVFSTAALARGGGGGGHGGGFSGGHFGGGHMVGHFGGFDGGHEHGEFRRGVGGFGFCDYPYRSYYEGCY
jgi:Spy/CpxP family protein refolding chaperone